MPNRRTLIILAVILVAAVAGFVYYRQQGRSVQAEQTQSAVQTAVVERGDVVLSADGSGELIPGTEVELAFPTGGTLTELLVQAGDEVQAGDVLARVDNADAQTALLSAQLQLLKAQQDLASAQTQLQKVKEGPSEADLLAAQTALASAQEAYDALLNGPDAREVEKTKLSLDSAKNSLWSTQLRRDATCGQPQGDCDQAQISVLNAEMSVRRAEMELEELMEPATEAELAAAKAKVAQAEEALEDLQSAPTEDDIAAAELQLEQAKLSLTQAEAALKAAQEELEQTTLVAPISGTVMAVNAKVGDKVASTAIITLADMASPQVRFWVEEADLNSVAPGNAVSIVFEAFSDYSFSGKILNVEPALTTVGNTPAVQALASVDLTTRPVKLLSGMNAEVEVIAAEARNALLVPVGALRELATDQYGVFVVKADGEIELRAVQVGLKDYVNAQILSGLQEGEVVRTSTTQSSQAASSGFGERFGPEMGPGVMIFEGPGGP